MLSMRQPEDMHIGNFLRDNGIKSTDVECPYFSGHFLAERAYQTFKWDPTKNKHYPVCPDKLPWQTECNSSLTQYKKVAFSHSWGNRLDHEQWKEWFDSVPDDAMVYYTNVKFNVCQKRKDI